MDTLADTVAGDGKVSLREAVIAADRNAGLFEAAAGQGGGLTDTITFAPTLAGGTITLGFGQLVINDRLKITGPGASRLTVDGDYRSRVFWVGATTAELSGLTVTRGFADGRVSDGDGGGIRSVGAVTLRDCVVRSNVAASVRFPDSGQVRGGYGGGIFSAGSMTLVGCTVSGNNAYAGSGFGSGWGGGIVNRGTLKVEGSTISGNIADYGGGIANGSTVTIANSTISGNGARLSGGGVDSGGPMTLRNVTIFGNWADLDGNGSGHWGGVAGGTAGLAMFNTLVVGNFRQPGAATVNDMDWSGSVAATSSHNLIGDENMASYGPLSDGINGNIVGVDWWRVVDTALRDNGGPTLTHALLRDSLAIDAGTGVRAAGVDGSPLQTDQRGPGFRRTVRGRVDIGAFELQAPAADLVGYLDGDWWVGVSDGTKFTTGRWAAWSDEDWDALGQADFTGDGKADVFGLLDGAWWVGASTGAAFQTRLWGGWSDLRWRDVKAADLDGDGKDDILARRDGEWWAALSTGTSFAVPKLWAGWAGLDWREFFTTDLDGDDRADLLGFADGQWWAGLSTGSGFAAPRLFARWADVDWRKLLVFDADGDGRSDVAGLVNGNWWVGKSSGVGFATGHWAGWADVSWRDTLTGDFDGDGRGDVAARSGGDWWIARSTGGAFAAPVYWTNWSDAAWRDVRAADFDGDGRADIAGRLDGHWWVARSTGSASATALWGIWSDAAWRAVGSLNVGDPAGAISSASLSAANSSSPAGLTAARDEPLALFWKAADEDEEFAGRLAAG